MCLDFINTVDPRHAPERRDFLATYTNLLDWAVHAGGLASSERARLAAAARRNPREAKKVLDRARSLREALYVTVVDLSGGRRPPDRELATVNAELQRALSMTRLVWVARRLQHTWMADPLQLDGVLWPIARSAADLLASERVRFVRECQGDDGCGWLFIDTSKNKRRRWCDMRVCGNRAKARRYQQRRRASPTPTGRRARPSAS